MAVTIKQVAEESGVSITTVSRVLNNNYPVRKETREVIEATIKRLNYKPNVMARSLVTKKTSSIGVVVPGITNLFFSTIVEEIENYLREFGYSIFLCNTGGSPDTTVAIDDILSKQVDGIIIIDPYINESNVHFYEKTSRCIPTIIINGDVASKKYNRVAYNEKKGTEEAFQHLRSLGHKKILFIRGKQSVSYDIKEGVYDEFFGNADYFEKIRVGDGNSIEVVEKTKLAFEKFIAEKGLPQAAFACNDLMAVGVLNACIEKDIKVPEEFSIIGFDNTLISNITKPRISSVDQNMGEVAKCAGRSLLQLIKTENKAKIDVVLETKLICKESCK